MHIQVFCEKKKIGELFEGDKMNYIFEYLKDVKPESSLSLSMPSTQRLYTSNIYLHPFFDSFIPEGYLFEILKNIINKKEGKVNDFIMLYYLASGVDGRITFKGKEYSVISIVNLNDILENDTWDTFQSLLSMFLYKNAISGVQPKTLVVVKDKAHIEFQEFIVKTFGEEYKNLAENEYFCMKAVERAKIDIPKIYISHNKRFLVIEKFTKKDGNYLGFEEVGSVLGRRRYNKYEGSYEQIAKAIKKFCTNPTKELEVYYKMIVMNFLIKNGDAHNKNFGFLYLSDFSRVWLAPAYDVVCTTVYIPEDKPALMLKGKKVWHSKKELEEFGIKYCAIEEKKARELFDECKEALLETIKDIEVYIRENRHFEDMGKRIVGEWNKSLKSM